MIEYDCGTISRIKIWRAPLVVLESTGFKLANQSCESGVLDILHDHVFVLRCCSQLI
jgi:hypothetical protein